MNSSVVTGSAGNSADLGNVTLYDASNNPLGTFQFTGGSLSATSTLSGTGLLLPANTDTIVTVKGNLALVGVSNTGIEGDLIKVNPANAEGNGVSSGKTIDSGMVTVGSVSGVRLYKSFPLVAAGPAAPTNPNGGSQVLKRFSIAANSAGQIGINQLAISLATSSARVTNLQLHAYTDSGYSQYANVPGSTSGQFGVTDGVTAPNGSTAYTSNTLTSNPTLYFVAQSAPFEIGANSTVYFTLTGDVAPVSNANNWTISTSLLGDATQVAVTNVAALATGSYNFVWSPNATSTSATTGVGSGDWTNGAGVSGLPSTGL
jgi:hypothetical protein